MLHCRPLYTTFLLLSCSAAFGCSAEAPANGAPAFTGAFNTPGSGGTGTDNGNDSNAGSTASNTAGQSPVGNAGSNNEQNNPQNGVNSTAGSGSSGGNDSSGNNDNQQSPDNQDPDNDDQQNPDDNQNPDNNPQPTNGVGRVGAELCPQGPFGDPLPGNLDVQVFARQEDGGNFANWEGVVWTGDALYWSSIENGNGARIHRRTLNGPTEFGFIQGADSNGLALDPDGNLISANQGTKGIARFSLPGGQRSEFRGETFNGQRFNSPNDLVLRTDGNLYFTDPNFQSGGDNPQNSNRVYRIAPDGNVTVVDDTFGQPNGITLSPDGSTLYVSGDGRLSQYVINPDGSTGPAQPFGTAPGGTVDGMGMDCAGNVYLAVFGESQVRVFSPDGTVLGSISGFEGQSITNVAFGGPNRTTLFVSSFVQGPTTGGIFAVELNIPGMPY